jgi:hypothetical protein
VILSTFRRLKKKNLIKASLKSSVPQLLGVLNLYHIMVHQVAQSLSRKVIDLLGERLHKTNM